MSVQRRPLVAGNWKMNGLKPAAAELGKIVHGSTELPNADLLVCPPATLVMMFASAAHGSKVAIAYEPVWAIGTGLTPTAADVAEVHGLIRERLIKRFGAAGDQIRVLYGGSVKPANAHELLKAPNVDGALVGGASLNAEDFLGI